MNPSQPASHVKQVVGLVLLVLALLAAIVGVVGITNGFGAVEFVAVMGLAVLLAVTGYRLRASGPLPVS